MATWPALGRWEFERLDDDKFPVESGMAIYEMRDLAVLEWKDEDVTTVGFYVLRRLAHLRRVGEQRASTASSLRSSKPTAASSNFASRVSPKETRASDDATSQN